MDDVTGRFGRNAGVFDIFRTLLVNPNTGVQTTSGYVEVGLKHMWVVLCGGGY